MARNNVKMLPKSKAKFWEWLDDFADPGYKVLECDWGSPSKMKTEHFVCFSGILTTIDTKFSIICSAKLDVEFHA